MTIKVMLVDDSAIIRSLIGRALTKTTDITVVAMAADGLEAIDTVKTHRPDIVMLDVEMPRMDGLAAIPLLLQAMPGLKIIMVSRLTQRSAGISLAALEKGAVDYIPKPADNTQLDAFYEEMIEKIRAVAVGSTETPPLSTRSTSPSETPASAPSPSPQSRIVITGKAVRALAIASSTGGPQALMQIFEQLKDSPLRIPVFITQHMPPIFTACLAENLSKISGIPCHEGKDREIARPGHAYVAPGGYHMLVRPTTGEQTQIRLTQDPPVNSCRPAADPMFASIADVYGTATLGIVLTGMGRDGCAGAKKIRESGGKIIAQNAESCVVYGMPRAVVEAGLADEILPLSQISVFLRKILA